MMLKKLKEKEKEEKIIVRQPEEPEEKIEESEPEEEQENKNSSNNENNKDLPVNSERNNSENSDSENQEKENSKDQNDENNKSKKQENGNNSENSNILESLSNIRIEVIETEDNENEIEENNNVEEQIIVSEVVEEIDEGDENLDENTEDENNDETLEHDELNNEEMTPVDTSVCSKYYQTEFYRFLRKFAEENTKVISYHDYEKWNIKKLMFRQYEKKPLSAYRCSTEKEKVILIIDDSGSMSWWTQNLSILATIALKRGDVEIYFAPNGFITSKLTKKGIEEAYLDIEKLVGRKIIYVGDFDGATTPIILSQKNTVVWICPEKCRRHYKSYITFDKDFKGVFIRAWNLEEMFKGLRKVNKFRNLWIDFHEDEHYDDE